MTATVIRSELPIIDSSNGRNTNPAIRKGINIVIIMNDFFFMRVAASRWATIQTLLSIIRNF